MRGCRRFFRSTLQPIAEHLEYNPVAVAARYRGNYLGSVSLPTQQASSYSAAPVDKPKREGGTPDELPGQALDPNREPPEGSLEKQGGGTPAKVCALPCALGQTCSARLAWNGIVLALYSVLQRHISAIWTASTPDGP